MARRESSSDPRAVRTREALVNATIDLLATQRAEDLSVSGIVKAAKVSRQVFYEHFEDRDAVAIAAAEAVLMPAYHEFSNNFVFDTTYGDQVRTLTGTVAPHLQMVCNLLDSPVHAKLNQQLCEVLFPAMRAGLRQVLDAEDVQATDELVDDATVFLVTGTQHMFERACRNKDDADDIARRIENMRRLLARS